MITLKLIHFKRLILSLDPDVTLPRSKFNLTFILSVSIIRNLDILTAPIESAVCKAACSPA